MIEKVIEYMLCYTVAFFLGFLACSVCTMILVYFYGQRLKIKTVTAIRARHLRRKRYD